MALAVRKECRLKRLTGSTAGLAPRFIQANLIVLPSKYAPDFRLLCQRNPVPCPLIAESIEPGRFDCLRSYFPGISDEQLAEDVDIRHDFPRYRTYREGVYQGECSDIEAYWAEDSVAFLIGCSYSFEAALAKAGLPAAHVAAGKIVPMYRTTLPLCPSGVFTGGTYVVSMRPYRQADIDRVRSITADFTTTHGEPVTWGWDGMRALGIKDISQPQWGDKPVMDVEDDLEPVFWGCGVTPQEAVMRAKLSELVMSHSPGHMLVLDVKDGDVFGI